MKYYVFTLKRNIYIYIYIYVYTIGPMEGYTTYTVWLIAVLVHTERTYEFIPLNGGN